MINYYILGQSCDYYSKNGYQRIETPWTVTEQINKITAPPGSKMFRLKHENDKVLVASAEQSFLYLNLKGFLPKGRYQSITPCFRGDSFDELHSKYFIKNELINTADVTTDNLQSMIEDALYFFGMFLPKDGLKVVSLEESYLYDITYNGDELGSYGIRKCSFLKWIFGTGVAEPRLTAIRQKWDII